MWDYDKLFAEDNVVILKNKQLNKIFPSVIGEKRFWGENGYVDWFQYFNDNLSFYSMDFDFEIQYIIRLDEHGNVIEQLFNRDKDMPEPMPELETGMFVKVKHENEEKLGYIDVEHNKVIYQSGGWDEIEGDYGIICCSFVEILAIYEQDAICFDGCCKNKIIWRKPESK